jgi:hypothetical protein
MATEYLRPNAAGDETNIASQYPSSTYHWDKVDEETADDDSTYVSTSITSYQRDLYNLSNPTGSGTINYIKVWYRFRGATGLPVTAYLTPAIKTGGTAYEGSEDTETAASYKNGSYQWTTNPQTGVAWTWDDLTALQAGVKIKGYGGKSCRCTQVYVEVDYTSAVTEKTSSDTGSGVDAYVLLETGEAKTSSDAGSGVEGMPLPSATLTGSETGSGIEALVARLLAAFDTGTSAEVAQVVGLLNDLFASELGWGSDSLTAKIEIPTKGGGMKLWT